VPWQVWPVAAGLVTGLVLAAAGRPRRRLPALLAALVCAGLVLAGAVAAWAFPVPVFPAPAGPHAVGTAVLEWTDPAREDRIVVAQLWYPAEPGADGPRAQYLGRTPGEARTVARAFLEQFGLPGFLLDGAARARTHAVPDAPPLGGAPHPVVLFSPGLSGVRTQNTAWAEDLASRGYVVAALDHPYDSAAVVLADGRTIRGTIRATGDDAEDQRVAEGAVAVRVADLRFALTRLEGVAFVDTARAVAAGHSLGGGAALLAVREDPRFAAGVDIDGYPYGPDPQPFDRPVLALTGGRSEGSPDYPERLERVLRASGGPSYRVTVPGAAHFTFTDAPLWLPPVPAIVGTLPRREGPRVTAAATAAFLDAALDGDAARARTDLARYGEVTAY
jgi:dienelactone hydrolase